MKRSLDRPGCARAEYGSDADASQVTSRYAALLCAFIVRASHRKGIWRGAGRMAATRTDRNARFGLLADAGRLVVVGALPLYKRTSQPVRRARFDEAQIRKIGVYGIFGPVAYQGDLSATHLALYRRKRSAPSGRSGVVGKHRSTPPPAAALRDLQIRIPIAKLKSSCGQVALVP